MKLYPGTTVTRSELSGKQFLNAIFLGTNGLVMQQLKELAGVTTPAIQNWVSRGFIPRPVNKRYSKDVTARIFIINVLRNTMSLEDIKKLLLEKINYALEENSEKGKETSEKGARKGPEQTRKGKQKIKDGKGGRCGDEKRNIHGEAEAHIRRRGQRPI